MKPNQKPFIIGITGGSASGKTLFLNQLLKSFSEEEICLISQDNYYRTLAEQKPDENGFINFDEPESLDLHQYALDIQRLQSGDSFQKLEYTFNNPDVIPRMLTYQPKPIIVVEGLFVFSFKELADSLDLKIFIDAKRKLRLDRRMKRDTDERGFVKQDEILYIWNNHVEPAFQKYVKPYRKHADIVIPNNVHFEKGLEILVGYLRTKI